MGCPFLPSVVLGASSLQDKEESPLRVFRLMGPRGRADAGLGLSCGGGTSLSVLTLHPVQSWLFGAWLSPCPCFSSHAYFQNWKFKA